MALVIPPISTRTVKHLFLLFGSASNISLFFAAHSLMFGRIVVIMTTVKIEQYIRARALDLGFGAIGFARVDSSKSFHAFQEWLSRGYGAEMHYLERHAALRMDPRNLLPSAKTIVVVGARYPSAKSEDNISSHAFCRDYHDVLRDKLALLASTLEKQHGAPIESRICVDTAPLAEREWAVRAGIGWIGKQGSVVSPNLGACFFLGELLVDIELEPSAPIANLCGDCNLCGEACPNKAVLSGSQIDARRCISYLTIEHKKNFSPETSMLINGSVFGCDRCTAVCPLNRRACAPVMKEFDSPEKSMPELAECLALDRCGFKKYFGRTPVERIGLERFRRNVNVVIANTRKKMALGGQKSIVKG